MYVGMLAFWSAILVVVRGPPCNTACGEFRLILNLFLVMPGVAMDSLMNPMHVFTCVCMYAIVSILCVYVCMSLCTRIASWLWSHLGFFGILCVFVFWALMSFWAFLGPCQPASQHIRLSASNSHITEYPL